MADAELTEAQLAAQRSDAEAERAMGRIIKAIATLPFAEQHAVIRNVLMLSSHALDAPSTSAWARLNADQIMHAIKAELKARGEPTP